MEQEAIDRLVLGCLRYEHFDGADTGVRDLAAADERIAQALKKAESWVREEEAGPESYAGGWEAWYAKFTP